MTIILTLLLTVIPFAFAAYPLLKNRPSLSTAPGGDDDFDEGRIAEEAYHRNRAEKKAQLYQVIHWMKGKKS